MTQRFLISEVGRRDITLPIFLPEVFFIRSCLKRSSDQFQKVSETNIKISRMKFFFFGSVKFTKIGSFGNDQPERTSLGNE